MFTFEASETEEGKRILYPFGNGDDTSTTDLENEELDYSNQPIRLFLNRHFEIHNGQLKIKLDGLVFVMLRNEKYESKEKSSVKQFSHTKLPGIIRGFIYCDEELLKLIGWNGSMITCFSGISFMIFRDHILDPHTACPSLGGLKDFSEEIKEEYITSKKEKGEPISMANFYMEDNMLKYEEGGFVLIKFVNLPQVIGQLRLIFTEEWEIKVEDKVYNVSLKVINSSNTLIQMAKNTKFPLIDNISSTFILYKDSVPIGSFADIYKDHFPQEPIKERCGKIISELYYNSNATNGIIPLTKDHFYVKNNKLMLKLSGFVVVLFKEKNEIDISDVVEKSQRLNLEEMSYYKDVRLAYIDKLEFNKYFSTASKRDVIVFYYNHRSQGEVYINQNKIPDLRIHTDRFMNKYQLSFANPSRQGTYWCQYPSDLFVENFSITSDGYMELNTINNPKSVVVIFWDKDNKESLDILPDFLGLNNYNSSGYFKGTGIVPEIRFMACEINEEILELTKGTKIPLDDTLFPYIIFFYDGKCKKSFSGPYTIDTIKTFAYEYKKTVIDSLGNIRCSWCTNSALEGESLCRKCKENRASKRGKEKNLGRKKVFKVDKRPIEFTRRNNYYSIRFIDLQIDRSYPIMDCGAPFPNSKYPGTFELIITECPSMFGSLLPSKGEEEENNFIGKSSDESPNNSPSSEFEVIIPGEEVMKSRRCDNMEIVNPIPYVSSIIKSQENIFHPHSNIFFTKKLKEGKDYKIKMTISGQERHFIYTDPYRTYYAIPSLLGYSSENFLPYYAIELPEKGIFRHRYYANSSVKKYKNTNVVHGRTIKKNLPYWLKTLCTNKQPEELEELNKTDSIPLDIGPISFWVAEPTGCNTITGTIHFYNQYSLSEKGKKMKVYNISEKWYKNIFSSLT